MAKPSSVGSADFQANEKATEVYSNLRRMAPVTRGDIKNYVKVYLGVDIPEKRICEGHNSPMEYLWHSYFAEVSTADRGDGMLSISGRR